MAKVRKPQANYTTVANELLRDKRISLKAKGLYALLFSKPDDWEYHEAPLIEESADGKDSFRSGLKELVDFGWLEKRQSRNSDGTVGAVEWWLSADGPAVAGKPADGQPAPTNTDLTKTDEVIPPVSPQPTKASRRGSTPAIRLEEFLRNSATPFDGLPPNEWGSWANEQFGWDSRRISSEWADFHDYWTSGNAVHGGRKADWPATWRSHCRRSANRGGGRTPGNNLDRGLAGAMRASLAGRNGATQAGSAVHPGQASAGNANADGGREVAAIPAGEIPF